MDRCLVDPRPLRCGDYLRNLARGDGDPAAPRGRDVGERPNHVDARLQRGGNGVDRARASLRVWFRVADLRGTRAVCFRSVSHENQAQPDDRQD